MTTTNRSALLIVNADDYGLTEGVSRAILTAYREGIVRSTSVLAVGPAFDRTVHWLLDHASIGVGVHLALVGEDPPLLSAREIPSLVDRRGRLPRSWRAFAARAVLSPPDPEEIRRELLAQVDRVRQRIPRLTHLDSHQHVHLWPSVRNVVTEIARASQISAIRVPRSSGSRWVGIGINRLGGRLETAARAAHLRFPSASIGFDDSGRLDETALMRLLTVLPRADARSVELLCHPGEANDRELARYRWNYRWSDELTAVCSPTIRQLVEAQGFRLGTFADL